MNLALCNSDDAKTAERIRDVEIVLLNKVELSRELLQGAAEAEADRRRRDGHQQHRCGRRARTRHGRVQCARLLHLVGGAACVGD